MIQHLYPLTFQPVFRDYIWGGRNLETLFGRRLPPGIIAESWEISAHPSSSTIVDTGPLAGYSLPQLTAEFGLDLVGLNSQETATQNRFPLLIKLLDAAQDLSVQVHPDDEYARIHGAGDPGKTEMWYVLHAEPGAGLICGLRPNVTPTSFRAALERGELEKCLHRMPVKQGDAIFIAPGTVHALLAGLVMAEIQQNSDLTYRVYDWNRLGPDGQPRPLHVEKAMEVINWSLVEPTPAQPQVLIDKEGLRRAELVHCRHFVVEEIRLGSGRAYQGYADGSTFEIWGCVAGRGEITWVGEPVALAAVRFALIPAALGPFTVEARVTSTLLRTYVPPPDKTSEPITRPTRISPPDEDPTVNSSDNAWSPACSHKTE